MTDFYGIYAGVKGAILTYYQAARGTGRTTSLVNRARDGDTLVFTNHQEAKRVERILRPTGKSVRYIVIDPKHPEDWHKIRGSQRVIFDHTFIEQYYLRAIEFASAELRVWQGRQYEPPEIEKIRWDRR